MSWTKVCGQPRPSPGNVRATVRALQQLVAAAAEATAASAADRRPSRARRHSRGRRRAALRAGVAMTTWILDKGATCDRGRRHRQPACDLTDLAITAISASRWLYSARSATTTTANKRHCAPMQSFAHPAIFDRVPPSARPSPTTVGCGIERRFGFIHRRNRASSPGRHVAPRP